MTNEHSDNTEDLVFLREHPLRSALPETRKLED